MAICTTLLNTGSLATFTVMLAGGRVCSNEPDELACMPYSRARVMVQPFGPV